MFKKNSLSPEEAQALLNCRRLPGRLNSPEVAALLGVSTDDISVLTNAKIVIPLGNPTANAPKYFASVEIEQVAKNRDLMRKITSTLIRHWQRKNEGKHSIKKTNDYSGLKFRNRVAARRFASADILKIEKSAGFSEGGDIK